MPFNNLNVSKIDILKCVPCFRAGLNVSNLVRTMTKIKRKSSYKTIKIRGKFKKKFFKARCYISSPTLLRSCTITCVQHKWQLFLDYMSLNK